MTAYFLVLKKKVLTNKICKEMFILSASEENL